MGLTRLAPFAVAIAAAVGPAAPAAGTVKVNFQSETAPVPSGYVRDFGEPFGLRGGGLSYGWVVPGTSTPLSLVGNGRDRNRPGIAQRLDTIIHLQGGDVPGFTGVTAPGAWEIAEPNGTYRVTVSAGDAVYDSRHVLNVEGSTALGPFVPSASAEYANVTVLARVRDGRLTIDPAGGTNTKLNYVIVAPAAAADSRPAVTSISPANWATGVPRDSAVAADVQLPNVGKGVDTATLAGHVTLVRASDGAPVAANVNTSGGGDAIVLQPTAPLAATTTYRFDVTAGVKDRSRHPFLPFRSFVTTGTTGGGGGGPVSFTKVALPTATGHAFTSLAIGPDGKLYASTIDGYILRFPLAADGTTGTPEVIDSLRTANGGARMLIGLAFDPASTAADPVVWVTHSAYAFDSGPDWAGRVTRMSGPGLATVSDYVVGLPRSIRDHVTNSLAFGPDGALYLTQGSNSAMGAPDSAWGLRSEHVLNAAVLRIDVTKITAPPLDVKTEEGGTYDPFAAGAPVTVFASGIRNAYDLVWHTNGRLYVPTNGSAAGGNTPGTPSPLPPACSRRIDGTYTGPSVPALTNVGTQHDYLFRAVAGGYYGHPNPKRCEWVLNGGNPTAATDPAEVGEYPVGTLPDRNWRGAAYDFGEHFSPDGAIEYRSATFGGALQGRLLIARFSAGDDIIVLQPGGANGDIVSAQTGLPGMTGFTDPLDLVEDRATGRLYVSEYSAQRITLLRPVGG